MPHDQHGRNFRQAQPSSSTQHHIKRDLPTNLTLRARGTPNFKTWRIMHIDYRRPIDTFTETISTVVALHFYATA